MSQIDGHQIRAVFQRLHLVFVYMLPGDHRGKVDRIRANTDSADVHRPDKPDVFVPFVEGIHLFISDAAVAHNHLLEVRHVGKHTLHLICAFKKPAGKVDFFRVAGKNPVANGNIPQEKDIRKLAAQLHQLLIRQRSPPQIRLFQIRTQRKHGCQRFPVQLRIAQIQAALSQAKLPVRQHIAQLNTRAGLLKPFKFRLLRQRFRQNDPLKTSEMGQNLRKRFPIQRFELQLPGIRRPLPALQQDLVGNLTTRHCLGKRFQGLIIPAGFRIHPAQSGQMLQRRQILRRQTGNRQFFRIRIQQRPLKGHQPGNFTVRHPAAQPVELLHG